MKKWLSLFLVLCVLTSVTGALAAAVTVTSGSSEAFSADGATLAVASVAEIGGTGYLLYADGRVTALNPANREETALGNVLYTGGMATAQSVTDALNGDSAGLAPVEQLFADGTRLYGFSVATGECYALLDETGAFAPAPTGVTLDTAAMVGADGENKQTLLDACVQDGLLYLVTRDDTSGQLTTALSAIDLASGQAKAFTVDNVQDVEPYQAGSLLVRRYDMSALYTATSAENLPATDYGVFNPAADAYTQLGTIATENVTGGYAISGMVYTAANDSLYYAAGSRIEGMTLATGQTRVSAYTSEGMLGGMGALTRTALLAGFSYLKADATGWQLYALDGDAVQRGALRIFGEFGSEAHKSFSKNYPDIPVDVAAEFTTSLEALANAMVSENDAYDVLLLMMSYMPVDRLVQKGYCTDLSVYPEIMERVARLDPRFVAAMTVDGKLYGVPVSVMAYDFGVNLEQWEALGLTQDDLPTNLLDMCDFIAHYQEDYGEDHPDLRLFDMGGDNLKIVLFSRLLLESYLTYSQAELGGITTFNTDLCRRLLTAFEQIDFDALTATQDEASADFQTRPNLFSAYLPLTSFESYYDSLTPLVLPLTAETKPLLSANVSVLVLNPKSTRMDDAVKYICNYLDNLDDSSAIVLRPDDNEPRIAKDYEKNVQTLQDAVAKKQALLDAAEESQKAALREELDQLAAQLAQTEEHKYAVSAEQIEDFRNNISALLTISQQSLVFGSDETALTEINKLIMQYLDGANTQEQFLTELDKRVRMMQLENQ